MSHFLIASDGQRGKNNMEYGRCGVCSAPSVRDAQLPVIVKSVRFILLCAKFRTLSYSPPLAMKLALRTDLRPTAHGFVHLHPGPSGLLPTAPRFYIKEPAPSVSALVFSHGPRSGTMMWVSGFSHRPSGVCRSQTGCAAFCFSSDVDPGRSDGSSRRRNGLHIARFPLRGKLTHSGVPPLPVKQASRGPHLGRVSYPLGERRGPLGELVPPGRRARQR